MFYQQQRVTFGEFSFQIPAKLCFDKNVNEQFGESLFVYDLQEKYTFYFETDMPCFDLRHRGNQKYCSEEYTYAYERIRINLCYPATHHEGRGCMVYFHAELLDSNGDAHILPGQMKIEFGNDWSAEAKRILMELLRSVKINDMKTAC